MSPARRILVPLLAVAVLGLAALGPGGCGEENDLNVPEGVPVELGNLEYKVLFSRFLNINDTEDHAYLQDEAPPGPDELYLGIFLQVENTGEHEESLPAQLTVTDTQHTKYDSLPIRNDWALELGSSLPAGEEDPGFDTPAASGPIKGSMVLFRIKDASTENRPLELEIPGEDGPARVDLDI
jgi:hypothetical protein